MANATIQGGVHGMPRGTNRYRIGAVLQFHDTEPPATETLDHAARARLNRYIDLQVTYAMLIGWISGMAAGIAGAVIWAKFFSIGG